MESNERNALADLAERLEVEAKFVQEIGRNGRPIYNAQRIIAELAKVENVEVKDPGFKPYLFPSKVMSAEAVNMCRAIAEEGASDER